MEGRGDGVVVILWFTLDLFHVQVSDRRQSSAAISRSACTVISW